MESEFGAATDIDDFERKAQMLNYVEHRAIFEGFNSHLWTPNSGRLLWMTQPAWPSSSWQILSSDYDTQASFYGVKKACEPVHVQLDLVSDEVDVVNTTLNTMPDASLSAKVYSLENKLLFENSQKMQVGANALTSGFKLDLAPFVAGKMVFVRLALNDVTGKVVSDNFYWLSREDPSSRPLNRLPPASVSVTASATRAGDEIEIHVQIENDGTVAALANKFTLEAASDGERILPAYWSDNYVSLLPGETRTIEIEYPASAAPESAKIEVRGWNLPARTISVSPR